MQIVATSPQATNVTTRPLVRVVLVEDDHDLRQSVADYLRLRAFDVTEVDSALGFYKALNESEFDIAILDVNLPDASGFDLARGVASGKRMGVIMLTARTGRDDRIKGYEEGADLYLTKPVDGEELALAVGNLARRIHQAGARPANTTVSTSTVAGQCGWRLERERQRLTSPQGLSIPLSGREFMLMEQLARSDGATLSRAAIGALFGHVNPDPESRRLDAALRRLRLKAKDAGTDLPLQSVHAAGIRFTGALEVV
ncbi:response regulator transcription factor [Mesorhizobium sp. ANAO-SY3R2]|uniref:response regulator transcription factor n=1 Tax=Mesorhizobium sp. ANAO-SY3R2 TaxID=3166644 RepID=UPI00366DAC4D